MIKKHRNKLIALFTTLSSIPVFAQTGGITQDNIGSMATNILETLAPVASLIVALSVIAGLGFGVAAIFKFKQHRDNPTQVPLGQPLALLAIAVMLLWFQYLLQAAGQSMTGGEGQSNQSTIGKDTPSWIVQ